MKTAVLSVLAGGVAAQLTLPPAMNIAAIDISDPEFTTCSAAADYIAECVESLGGADAVQDADEEELVACACCAEGAAISNLFSVCSTYLKKEAPTMSSQYSAYGGLYSVCALSAECGASRPTRTTGGGSTEATETESSGEYPDACYDMAAVVTSCASKIVDFTKLPVKAQASCFCCRGVGRSKSWTDELGEHASTCADWAITGEPDTAYPLASQLVTLCERFDDVCDAADPTTTESEEPTTTEDEDEETSTTDESSANTDDSDDGDDDGEETETETVTIGSGDSTNTAATETTTDNSAAPITIACGAILAALAGFAIAL